MSKKPRMMKKNKPADKIKKRAAQKVAKKRVTQKVAKKRAAKKVARKQATQKVVRKQVKGRVAQKYLVGTEIVKAEPIPIAEIKVHVLPDDSEAALMEYREATRYGQVDKEIFKPEPIPKAEIKGQELPAGLEAALMECRQSARRGHKIAKENLSEMEDAIHLTSKSLSLCLKSLDGGLVLTQPLVDDLNRQLTVVMSELELHQRTANSELEKRRLRLDKFSVALFGRTLAGKSTLMEILTRGNGQSIGTGAQRTTRDVRSYYWEGLEVTDVPGIAAFEGKDDKELAYKTASQADLVLFLITDDAPQPVEAECLAQVCLLGKPVLGICNVKAAVDDEEDLRLFLRNPDQHFDPARLEPLLDQFHEFAEQHIPGKRVTFAVTHLRARFLAETSQYHEYSDRLLAASRFKGIEAKIMREVVGRGAFLRIKSFIDGTVAPMMDLTDRLLGFSAKNISNYNVLKDKGRQFREWGKEFETRSQERINTIVSKVMNDLRKEASSFAEDHFEDPSAGEKWNRRVESTGINNKVARLQKELLDELRKELNEVAREVMSELSLVESLAGDRQIKMDSILDLKRVWNWGTGIGLAIAAFSPLGLPLVIVVGIAGWLISCVIDSREEKAKRARKKLTEKLLRNIDKMEHDLNQRLGDWFQQELLDKQVFLLLIDFDTGTSGLHELANAQRTLAQSLNNRQKSLGRSLVKEALDHLDVAAFDKSILDVARVPGIETMVLVAPDTTIPQKIADSLELLMNEKIRFLIDTKNRSSNLAQAIGEECDQTKIRIEDQDQVAHVPIGDLTALAKARVRLAQQLTGLHVMQ